MYFMSENRRAQWRRAYARQSITAACPTSHQSLLVAGLPALTENRQAARSVCAGFLHVMLREPLKIGDLPETGIRGRQLPGKIADHARCQDLDAPDSRWNVPAPPAFPIAPEVTAPIVSPSLRYIPSAHAISPKKGFEDSLRSKKNLSTKVDAPAASNGLERDVF